MFDWAYGVRVSNIVVVLGFNEFLLHQEALMFNQNNKIWKDKLWYSHTTDVAHYIHIKIFDN